MSEFPWSDPLDGLPLLQASDPSWCKIAMDNLDAVLIDHAFCEHKAASMALRLIGQFPEHNIILRPLLALVREEMMHYRQVLDLLDERGVKMPKPVPDRYVKELRRLSSSQGAGLGALGDLLLACAFVEARSCERFRLLAQYLTPAEDPLDKRLGKFYLQLSEAEGRHWESFQDLSNQLCGEAETARRLKELAEMEAEVIRNLPVEARMH